MRVKTTMETNRERFVRIAMARIKKNYPFKPQRLAIASKMYANWRQRKQNEKHKKQNTNRNATTNQAGGKKT